MSPGVITDAGPRWVPWRRRRREPAAATGAPFAADAWQVLEHLPTAVVISDPSGEPVLANGRAAALGVTAGGRLEPQQLREQVRETRRRQATLQSDYQLPADLGPHRPTTVRAATHPLHDGRVLALIDDITESVRVEAVRRDFVANVGHEIKTPVAGIELLVEAANRAQGEPEVLGQFLARLRRETGRLARLVQDILDLSRLQGGDPLPSPTVTPLAAVIDEAVDRIAPYAAAKGVRVDVEAATAFVAGNHQQLVTALTNLLDNAIAYSPTASRVAIGAQSAGEFVDVFVTDHGCGIPPAEQDRIFERFYRVDPARSRETGGTGLGLAIVKHIVSNHGGTVRVWSRPGEGSTFTVHLPVAAEPLPIARPALEAERTG